MLILPNVPKSKMCAPCATPIAINPRTNILDTIATIAEAIFFQKNKPIAVAASSNSTHATHVASADADIPIKLTEKPSTETQGRNIPIIIAASAPRNTHSFPVGFSMK